MGNKPSKPKKLGKRGRQEKLEGEITARDAVFIAEKLKPGVGNGEAAQRAGLKAVPSNPNVKKVLRNLIRKQLDLANIGAAEVVAEVKRMAMFDIGNIEDENGAILPLHAMDEDTRRALVGVECKELFEWEGEGKDRKQVLAGYIVRVKSDKTKALEMLMKHFGMLSGEGKKGGDRLNEVVAAMQAGPVGS